LTWARVTLPGISSVSTVAAEALETAIDDTTVIHATPITKPSHPCSRMT
jgi:hypothetical protein